MNRFFAIFLSLFFPTFLVGQINIDQSLTPQEIVEQHLLGEGVAVENITFNGQSADLANPQIATFTGGWDAVKLSQGIILATGDALVAEGPNDIPTAYIPVDEELTAEPDLEQLLGSGTDLNDVAVLSFDFTARGDTLRFSYVFASEEYNEHTCSPYNDVFGFFISGPGIEGNPQFENNALNLAKIPGTETPVAINTVNNGEAGEYGSAAICNATDPNWQANSGYFVDNALNNSIFSTQFDGLTKVFKVEIPVVCGGTYRIKMAIADAVDGKNDSAVFIESESFESKPPLEVEVAIENAFDDSLAMEGCSVLRVHLERSDSLETEVIYLESAYAESHPDLFPDFPDSLVFYPAQGHMEWNLPVHQDGIFEGVRPLDLAFLQPEACGLDTARIELETLLTDVPELELTYVDSILFSCDEVAQVDVSPAGGLPPYSINWEGDYEGFQFLLEPDEPLTLTGSVTDACNLHQEEISIFVSPEEFEPLSVVLPSEFAFTCINPVTITPSVSGGRGDYTYDWSFGGVSLSTEAEFNGLIEEEGVLTFSVADGCAGTESVTINLHLLENPITVYLGEDREGSCDEEILFQPEVSGGFGSMDFLWKMNFNQAGTGGSFSFVPNGFSVVTLEVTDQCGQEAADTVFILVDNPPMVVDLPSDTAVCQGERLDLIPVVSGGSGSYTYDWKERGSDAPFLSIIPSHDVTYTLEVTDECKETVSAEITIDLVEVEADFEFDYESDHRPIQNLSVFGLAYFWTLPDGQTSTAFEPDFVPLAGVNQLVGLEVTHPAGCTDQVVKFYDPPLNVFIPNAFTPDGDGLNDIFKAEGTFIKTFDLWIFDRWGNVVFHSDDPDKGWDGSDSSDDFSGQSLIYSYRLRAEGYSGEVLDKKGSVQVLR